MGKKTHFLICFVLKWLKKNLSSLYQLQRQPSEATAVPKPTTKIQKNKKKRNLFQISFKVHKISC